MYSNGETDYYYQLCEVAPEALRKAISLIRMEYNTAPLDKYLDTSLILNSVQYKLGNE